MLPNNINNTIKGVRLRGRERQTDIQRETERDREGGAGGGDSMIQLVECRTYVQFDSLIVRGFIRVPLSQSIFNTFFIDGNQNFFFYMES